MTDANRLEAVETQCAHLERALQELSDVVYRQQQELDRTQARQQQLIRYVESLEGQGDPPPAAAEVPPHF